MGEKSIGKRKEGVGLGEGDDVVGTVGNVGDLPRVRIMIII